ncbi:citrate synthase [Alteribacillus sp. HJP-4]|uniref:citrate synthase n=1 Tax=Alteribacillus sp. HJP-4 TaxID=2775394 RepID=UPI0035CCCCB5
MNKVLKKGLEGTVVAETTISLVDGEKGKLVYRGEPAEILAEDRSFEEVCWMLWNGNLPVKGELEKVKNDFLLNRELPEYVFNILRELPQGMPMMSAVRTGISALGDEYYQWPPTINEAVKLTAAVPVIIAARWRMQNELEPVPPHSELDHVENFLYMLTGEVPHHSHVKAMTAYFILTMEHGLNASTFAARVIASTEADMASAVTGAIAAMKGSLHGGAPSGVFDMLEQIKHKIKAEPWLREQIEGGKKLMGFGHRVYKTTDPRAEALKKITSQLTQDDPWLELAHYVENKAITLLHEYKPGRKLYTNVEFYAAAVLRAADIPAELFTPVFTASRMAGWTAHIIEQAEDNRIYRPQAIYRPTEKL